MDASALASAESWLSAIAIAKLVAAFLVAAGVVIEFGGDWVARPFEKAVKDAREAQLASLNNDTARLSAEAETAKGQIAETIKAAAMANERAEELRRQNLELERAVAPRIIEQGGFARAMQGQFPNGKIFITSVSELEARRLAQQLVFPLNEYKPTVIGYNDNLMDGVEILYVWKISLPPLGKPPTAEDFSPEKIAANRQFSARGESAAKALAEAFKANKIDAIAKACPDRTLNSCWDSSVPIDALLAKIGMKPATYFIDKTIEEIRSHNPSTNIIENVLPPPPNLSK